VVDFNLQWNHDGKPLAMGPEPGFRSGTSYNGIVMRCPDSKRVGFVQVADRAADVYFHCGMTPAKCKGTDLVGLRFSSVVRFVAGGMAGGEDIEEVERDE